MQGDSAGLLGVKSDIPDYAGGRHAPQDFRRSPEPLFYLFESQSPDSKFNGYRHSLQPNMRENSRDSIQTINLESNQKSN